MYRVLSFAFFLCPLASASAFDEWDNLQGPGKETRIALRGHTGYYLSSDLMHGPAGALFANRERVNVWETFDLVSLGDGWFALRSHATKKYVRFTDKGAWADAAGPGDLERVRICVLSKALRRVGIGTKGNKFVSTENDNGSIVANRSKLDLWEQFEISFPKAYEPNAEVPAGVTKKWVKAGKWEELEHLIAVPGGSFNARILGGPIGLQARSQDLFGFPASTITFDGKSVQTVRVAGAIAKFTVKVPYAGWVYYGTSGELLLNLQTPLPATQELIRIPLGFK